MKFCKGDRVCYTSGRHCVGPANPVVGSEHECPGTIMSIGGGPLHEQISVAWDNGTRNYYMTKDLELVGSNLDSDDPNIAFRFRKRR